MYFVKSIYCTKCGKTGVHSTNPDDTYSILRERLKKEGWTFDDKSVCPECKKKNAGVAQ